MKPWERRPKESYAAYEAFQTFLKERSYPKVSQALRKSQTLIKRWAKNNEWRSRADAWDNEVSKKAMEKTSEDFAKMIERQINEGRMLQGKAVQALQQIDFEALPPKFIPALINMIKIGVEVERSARTLKLEKPKENLFVETLTKLWEERGDDD